MCTAMIMAMYSSSSHSYYSSEEESSHEEDSYETHIHNTNIFHHNLVLYWNNKNGEREKKYLGDFLSNT